MAYQTVVVNLKENPYPIYIGAQLLANQELFAKHITGKQVLIVSNANIAKWYLEPLKKLLSSYQCDTFLLNDGEQFKTLADWQKIFDVLLAKGHERSTTLIALGGGIVGDMTGFAAACYQRGAHYIQVPTTLVAQVDSAIGGKTGVNHPAGKNMIGAFYQPKCVIADINALTTLPHREFCAGLAEVIKYGLINDSEFFIWLEKNMPQLLARNLDALQHVIYKSAAAKAQIVAQDEKESGLRGLLNLGHTFGHAIETAMNYQGILHGEAVAIGLAMAADLSARLTWIPTAVAERIQKLISAAELALAISGLPDSKQFLALMQRDKKVQAGKLKLILLKGIGEAVITTDAPQEKLVETLDKFLR